MRLEFHAPVFLRDLRMVSRGGNWRWNWKWLLSYVGASLFITAFMAFVNTGGYLVVQWLGFMIGAVIARMPVGFAADRAAGQQALLNLTGLSALRVFLESAAASLWAALELGLLAVPFAVVIMAYNQAPALAIPLTAAFPVMMIFWVASCWIVGVSIGSTRSTAAQVSTLFGALLVIPAVLGLWLKSGMPPFWKTVLFTVGGGDDWARLSEVYRPNGSALPMLRILARLLGWSCLYLVVAAWWFQRDWRRVESGEAKTSRWLRWFPKANSTWPRPISENNAYLRRMGRPVVWEKLRWVLGLIFVGLGILLAGSWNWLALPLVLLLWIGVVDTLAHITVSGVPALDRRSGALEMLFTTALNPRQLLETGSVVGHEVVRLGVVPTVLIAVVFTGVGWMKFSPANYPLPSDRGSLGVMMLWPVLYAAFLHQLPFRVPVSQSLNTGEPYHQFTLPPTPWVIPTVFGLLVWAMTEGSAETRWVSNFVGLIVLLSWLLFRRHFARSEGLDEEGLRTVAAAPLPVEGVIPKDKRILRPWIPEGFQR